MNWRTQRTRPRWSVLGRRYRAALLLAGLILVMFSATALAAEVAGGDTYVLPRGQVVNDDLYVSGGEVTIDGTVEGDLVVAGGYVEINGVVMGDLIAAGGAIIVAGSIQDDVRAAGAAVVVSGSVGDDLMASAGGGFPGMAMIPLEFAGRSVPLGLQITPSATVGGDAYVGGGDVTVAGAIGGDLNLGASVARFSGRVAGDAGLYANSLQVADTARVQGELRYATGSEAPVPEGVAATATREPWEPAEVAPADQRNVVWDVFGWLLRTALIIVGLALVGWLLWAFARPQVERQTDVIDARPAEAGLYGILVAVAVVPVSAALVFLAVLFWGWFPGGVVMFAFVFGLFALLWLFSPVVVGLWIGRKLTAAMGTMQGDLPSLLVGVVAIVLVGRVLQLVPCLGDLAYRAIYLASFALAVGSWLLARRRGSARPVPAASGDVAPASPA